MEKSVAQFTNRGMYQDVSISKATNEYAFENRNIRITALDEHTLFSVTNERGTTTVKTKDDEKDVILTGTYLGHTELNSTIVFFTHSSSTSTDYIYKIVFEDDKSIVTELYHGDLNFDSSHLIQTLPYYESEEVQKVYWVDGKNSLRVININAEYENHTGEEIDSKFDILQTAIIPEVYITKKYDGIGNFPSGVIQYFITYYNKYGCETNIVWGSGLNYINHSNRGADADDVVSCSFTLDIYNIDKSFTNCRVYSIKRTNLNGEVQASLVSDVKINNNDKITIVDTNNNIESIDPYYLLFLNRGALIASSITAKDDVLFLGNIEEDNTVLKDEIQTAIYNTFKTSMVDDIWKSTIVKFSTKTIKNASPKTYYDYKRQSDEESSYFRTFKSNEIYRFSIQFLSKKGFWSAPVWIGDLKCTIFPEHLSDNTIKVPTINCTLPESVTSLCEDFSHYRILMAEKTFENKSTIAQGVICPTVFNYDERLNNTTYARSSWIMRPRGSNISWKQYEPLNNEIQGTNALTTKTYKKASSVFNQLRIYITSDGIINHNLISLFLYDSKNDKLKCIYSPKPQEIYDLDYVIKTFEKYSGLDFETHINVSKYDLFKMHVYSTQGVENENIGSILGTNWVKVSPEDYNTAFPHIAETTAAKNNIVCLDKDILSLNIEGQNADENYEENKNNYYVDNSIVTFHSPDIENNEKIIDDQELQFRIIGCAKVTSNYSDADININTQSLSGGIHSIKKQNIINTTNNSKNTNTLVLSSLFEDYGWQQTEEVINGVNQKIITPSGSFSSYPIYMWHKQGSIVGANDKDTYRTTNLDTLDTIPSNLKDKTFGTFRFSYENKYFNTPYTCNIGNPRYYTNENTGLLRLNIGTDNNVFYSGNTDVLLTWKEPYYINGIQQYDPVRIKHSSTSHVVFSFLNTDKNKQILIPDLKNEKGSIDHLKKGYYYPWDYSNIDLQFSKIKCLGVYIDNGSFDTEKNFDNNFKFWWNNVVKYHIGESRINTILHSETSTFYVFLCTKSLNEVVLPYSISKVIKIQTKDNILALTKVNLYNITDDTIRQELNKKAFNVAQFTSYVALENHLGNPYAPSVDDFQNGYILFFDFDKSVNQIQYIQQNKYNNLELTFDISELDGFSYLYLGELYRDIPYNTLYGGYEDSAITSINWIPISNPTILSETTDKTDGDTYYQRWNCLKTYPTTEEDINKVVDVTSFMLESSNNLEGNYSSRAEDVKNVLTIRPSNFNLYNKVYNQSNNFFTFNTLDDKYSVSKHKNQLLWSLKKSSNETIDSWTKLYSTSVLDLDGTKGQITKLVNYNNSILAFQDKAISVINFNNRTALSTEGGVPIEIANSNKVDGYNILSTSSGCTDKDLSIITSSGLYYVDVYNSALYRFNGEGLSNISEKGMSVWFKANAKNIKRLLYDSTTQDLYIVTNNDVLLFNEKLQAFTTFVDYLGPSYKALFNIKGNSFIISSANNIHLYKMYAGGYASTYKMVYRVNPDPLMDKVFTNIEYLSELYDSTGANVNKSPFESLEVENEYQYGKTLITNTKYPMNRRKFRIWRMDLPRDTRSRWRLDRIRSPWITLTLNGKNAGERLEFHNLNVIYYK